MTNAAAITDEKRIAVVRHLASGKDADVVATITGLSRGAVIDVASNHGYPDTEKMAWAADVLAGRANDARRAEVPEGTVAPVARIPRPVAAAASTPAAATGPSDETRALLATAKGHPSKRIVAAADKVIDALGRLRNLMAEDDKKHAAKREADRQRTLARAEVERLTRQLAAAKAKLSGKPAAAPTSEAAVIRAWARGSGVDCPAVGRVPNAVREQYAAEQQAAS